MLVLTVGRENAQGGHPEALRETGSGRPINDPVIPAAAFRAGSKLHFNLSVWQGLIRRNAVYLTTIFAGAFAFELAFDTASNKIWDAMNRGRQWKDIKHRYMNKEEEEED
ncbi:hypothetical protein KXV22_004617 [Aspergillus fumigatus]|nr:hypothetical protein CNMCM8057_005628 [Aspergillus fumigatus]KAF4259669.1 hypothetical protein CNMCM8812_005772 [Aspergillus fumigatus]KAF4264651.1 hypothetical protein CNMCM8714_007355 [Aspergillus fumigatus]KAH1299240.1 hypothetical protein KXX11_006619 [Aspergillus fumigatus]KAH1302312.1 hypothetical protein KXX66_004871 [Aspergillus fumigatus]